MRRLLVLAGTLLLAFPATAMARGEFNPAEEWTLHEWIPIHLGPLDLSINKAVAYILLSALVTMLLGIGLMRVKTGRDPTRKQALGEQIYEIAQTQVAEQGLPHEGDRHAGSRTWRR